MPYESTKVTPAHILVVEFNTGPIVFEFDLPNGAFLRTIAVKLNPRGDRLAFGSKQPWFDDTISAKVASY
jgi:hypothetical protein